MIVVILRLSHEAHISKLQFRVLLIDFSYSDADFSKEHYIARHLPFQCVTFSMLTIHQVWTYGTIQLFIATAIGFFIDNFC